MQAINNEIGKIQQCLAESTYKALQDLIKSYRGYGHKEVCGIATECRLNSSKDVLINTLQSLLNWFEQTKSTLEKYGDVSVSNVAVTAHYYGTMLSCFVDQSPVISAYPNRILLSTSILDPMLPLEIAEGIKDEFNQIACDLVDESQQNVISDIRSDEIVKAVLDCFNDCSELFDPKIDVSEFDGNDEYPGIYFFIEWEVLEKDPDDTVEAITVDLVTDNNTRQSNQSVYNSGQQCNALFDAEAWNGLISEFWKKYIPTKKPYKTLDNLSIHWVNN